MLKMSSPVFQHSVQRVNMKNILPAQKKERKKKLYLYLQIHVCPRCCWSAWVYGKQQAWPSTARRWPGCPGGYTSSWASRGRPCPPPSSGNCGTCSGSRPRPRCPSAGCIWLFYRGRLFALWTEGTSSCGKKHTPGVNTPRYNPNTTAHYPATFEQIWQKRRWGKNAALVQAEILQLSDILLQSCTPLGDSNTKTQCVFLCVCVSKPSTTKLRNIFMTTPPHVPAFWSDSLFIKPRSSAASTECSLGDKTWSKLLPHFPQNIPDMCCGHGGSRWQIFQDKRELYSITGSSPTNVDVA